MKENYANADLEIIEFKMTDIICSSDCPAEEPCDGQTPEIEI